jgi:hypothetical protein
MNRIIDGTPPCRVADYMSTTIGSVDIDVNKEPSTLWSSLMV